jgi:hypothetical protein
LDAGDGSDDDEKEECCIFSAIIAMIFNKHAICKHFVTIQPLVTMLCVVTSFGRSAPIDAGAMGRALPEFSMTQTGPSITRPHFTLLCLKPGVFAEQKLLASKQPHYHDITPILPIYVNRILAQF